MFLKRWQQLNARERLLIAVGGSVVILLLGYFYGAQPAINSYIQLQKSIVAKEKSLTYLQAKTPVIRTLRATAPTQEVSQTEDMLTVLSQSIDKEGWQASVKKIRQTKRGHARVEFAAIAFDQFSEWLNHLWQDHRISADEIDIKNTATQGMIDVTVAFNDERR